MAAFTPCSSIAATCMFPRVSFGERLVYQSASGPASALDLTIAAHRALRQPSTDVRRLPATHSGRLPLRDPLRDGPLPHPGPGGSDSAGSQGDPSEMVPAPSRAPDPREPSRKRFLRDSPLPHPGPGGSDARAGSQGDPSEMVPAPSRAPDPREPSRKRLGFRVSRLRLEESSRRSTHARPSASCWIAWGEAALFCCCSA